MMEYGIDRQALVMQLENLGPGQQVTIATDSGPVALVLDGNQRVFVEHQRQELDEFHNHFEGREPSFLQQMYQEQGIQPL